MPIPTYDRLIDPLLHHLARSRAPIEVAAVHEAIADAVALTDADRALLLPSGQQPVYKNRLGWAHDRLKRAGLSTSPKRGYWLLTEEGRALAAKHARLPDEEVDRISTINADQRLSAPRLADDAATPTPVPVAVAAPVTAGPEERIEAAVKEIEESVRGDLLELIGRASPAFFERLVLRLLHAMGYGASPDDLLQTGGSGDEGIDGIISLDRLGLERVYVQAKRWRGSVGSPQVQTFMGALQLQGANKGVLMTTGAVTRDAREAAARARGRIVLVDGARLTELMIQHGVGVGHRVRKIPKVDGEFFEDE